MSNEFATKGFNEIAYVVNDPERQAAFEEEMKRQEECRKHIDELCLQSLEAMGVGMETIQKVLVENDTKIEKITALTDNLAKLGNAMAQMRLNMGYSALTGMGYGCGV